MSRAGRTRWLAAAVSLVVLATVGTAIALIDPPGLQRQRRLDERRVADLERIEHAVDEYARRHHRALPSDLAVLAAEPGLRTDVADPDSTLPYGYQVQDAQTYRLCATFARDSGNDDGPYLGGSNAWAHGKGQQCFSRKLGKE